MDFSILESGGVHKSKSRTILFISDWGSLLKIANSNFIRINVNSLHHDLIGFWGCMNLELLYWLTLMGWEVGGCGSWCVLELLITECFGSRLRRLLILLVEGWWVEVKWIWEEPRECVPLLEWRLTLWRRDWWDDWVRKCWEEGFRWFELLV